MQPNEKLYEESIKLIDNAPNLTTHAIPDHLLRVWLYNGTILPDPPYELLFATMIYKYANSKYGDPNLDSVADRHRFERFQHILAAEYICRNVGAKLRSRMIFDFPHHLEPLNIDIKPHQLKKFRALAVKIIPFRQTPLVT